MPCFFCWYTTLWSQTRSALHDGGAASRIPSKWSRGANNSMGQRFVKLRMRIRWRKRNNTAHGPWRRWSNRWCGPRAAKPISLVFCLSGVACPRVQGYFLDLIWFSKLWCLCLSPFLSDLFFAQGPFNAHPIYIDMHNTRTLLHLS
jgi:hypothetical protein